MVCRLVQNQELGIAKQDFSHSESHFFAARKCRGFHFEVKITKSETREHTVYPRIRRVAVKSRVFVVESCIFALKAFVFVASDISRSHFCGNFSHKPAHRVCAFKCGLDFLLKSVVVVESLILLQVAYFEIALFRYRSLVAGEYARNDVEKRRLACTVYAHKTDFIALVY